jgi:hypothetical protein
MTSTQGTMPLNLSLFFLDQLLYNIILFIWFPLDSSKKTSSAKLACSNSLALLQDVLGLSFFM